MLKQIKTLGLVVVIGSMLVGCDTSDVEEVQDITDTQIEETIEEEPQEQEEVEQEKIKKPWSKSERDQLVLKILTNALVEGGEEFDYEKEFLEYYAETGNDFTTFTEEMYVELTNVVLDTIYSDPTYEDLDITEEEVYEVVEMYIGSEIAVIDTNNLLRQTANIDTNKKITENGPLGGWETVEEDCLSISEVANIALYAFEDKYYEVYESGELVDSTLDYTAPRVDENSFVNNGTTMTIEINNMCDDKIGLVELDLEGNVLNIAIYE